MLNNDTTDTSTRGVTKSNILVTKVTSWQTEGYQMPTRTPMAAADG
jgi:hypothetical protein